MVKHTVIFLKGELVMIYQFPVCKCNSLDYKSYTLDEGNRIKLKVAETFYADAPAYRMVIPSIKGTFVHSSNKSYYSTIALDKIENRLPIEIEQGDIRSDRLIPLCISTYDDVWVADPYGEVHKGKLEQLQHIMKEGLARELYPDISIVSSFRRAIFSAGQMCLLTEYNEIPPIAIKEFTDKMKLTIERMTVMGYPVGSRNCLDRLNALGNEFREKYNDSWHDYLPLYYAIWKCCIDNDFPLYIHGNLNFMKIAETLKESLTPSNLKVPFSTNVYASNASTLFFNTFAHNTPYKHSNIMNDLGWYITANTYRADKAFTMYKGRLIFPYFVCEIPLFWLYFDKITVVGFIILANLSCEEIDLTNVQAQDSRKGIPVYFANCKYLKKIIVPEGLCEFISVADCPELTTIKRKGKLKVYTENCPKLERCF